MIEISIKNKKNSKIKTLILLLIVSISIYLTGCTTSDNGNNQSNNNFPTFASQEICGKAGLISCKISF